MIIGPTFFAPYEGDHEPGDGLTRLQTAFAGGSSADISSYALGSGTISGSVTLTDGLLSIALPSLTTNTLSWTNAGLRREAGFPLTVEYFFRCVGPPNDPAWSTQRLASLDNLDSLDDGGANGGTHYMGHNGFSGGVNPVSLGMDNAQYQETSPVDAFRAQYIHVAYVWNTGATGNPGIYVDGVREVNKSDASNDYISGNSIIYLGGTGHINGSPTVEFTGIRVRRAVMYSGASFTPPASPAAWGPP